MIDLLQNHFIFYSALFLAALVEKSMESGDSVGDISLTVLLMRQPEEKATLNSEKDEFAGASKVKPCIKCKHWAFN